MHQNTPETIIYFLCSSILSYTAQPRWQQSLPDGTLPLGKVHQLFIIVTLEPLSLFENSVRFGMSDTNIVGSVIFGKLAVAAFRKKINYLMTQFITTVFATRCDQLKTGHLRLYVLYFSLNFELNVCLFVSLNIYMYEYN